MNRDTKGLWDKKAKNFPRFQKDNEEVKKFLDFFREKGVDFRDKNIVDIGCGNGRYALELTKEAKKVFASDVSSEMLKNLEEDCVKFGIKNIKTILGEWNLLDLKRDFEIDFFDISFASMTPALSTKEGFLKAVKSAKEGLCYIGWGRERKSSFLEPIFKEHKVELVLPKGLPNVLEWSKEENLKVAYKYVENYFVSTKTLQEAIDDAKWHITSHNKISNEEKIKEYVEKCAKNGEVSYEQKREVGLAFICS